MDQEQTWLTTKTVGEDDNTAATMYDYFMRPEPRDNLGPIYEEQDEVFGRTVKKRKLKVGMVRNAQEENKKEVVAILEPYPHTRIDTAKPLQGWYKSLHEPAGVRPRPCFTEAVLTEPYGGWCLPPTALVETPNGPIQIQNLVIGDLVVGQKGNQLVASRVLATTSRWCKEGLLEITTHEGEKLQITSEHPIYSLDRLDYILAGELRHGEKVETRSLQELSKVFGERSLGKHSSVLSKMSFLTRENGCPCFRKSRPTKGSLDLYESELQPISPQFQLLRNLSNGSRKQSWKNEKRKVLPNPQRGATYSRSKGQTIKGSNRQTTLSENQTALCGASAIRDNRPQVVYQEQIRLQEGENLQSSLLLGESSRRVVRLSGHKLELRNGDNNSTQRRLLPTRLQIRPQTLHRSKRVYGQEGYLKDKESQETRLYHRDIRRQTNETTGSTIKEIKRLNKPLRVYDIQTTTENFYARGENQLLAFHLHNCAVGCAFCYVNSGMRGYRGTGLITVPLNYGDQIAKQLSKMRRGAAVYFSSFTDPFLPLEAYYHNTQRAAEECAKVGLPIFFLSRLRYPHWAVELLTKNKHSYAQKSINTPDPEDWRHLSPGALPLYEHLKDITRLRKAGVYVSIQCNPVIAGVTTNAQIVQLFKMLADAGANHVIVKFVEAGYSWAPSMVERMIKRFGDRGRAFADLFTENIGGQRTIVEEYRLKAHKLYSTYAKRYGLTYATCYEYRYERNEDGSIKNKTGTSIGRQFTTSSQCHGPHIPVYTRGSSEELFSPLEECPPSGCLYCASENNGQPRCGDALAGEAHALKLADLKVPIGEGVSRLPSLPIIG